MELLGVAVCMWRRFVGWGGVIGISVWGHLVSYIGGVPVRGRWVCQRGVVIDVGIELL